MISIRYVHLIINKYYVEQLLNIYAWETLMNACLQLNKIILEVLGMNIKTKSNIYSDTVAVFYDKQ